MGGLGCNNKKRIVREEETVLNGVECVGRNYAEFCVTERGCWERTRGICSRGEWQSSRSKS